MTVYMEAYQISRSDDGLIVERRPEQDRSVDDPKKAVEIMTLANALATCPGDDILAYTVYDPSLISNVPATGRWVD